MNRAALVWNITNLSSDEEVQ